MESTRNLSEMESDTPESSAYVITNFVKFSGL